MSSAALDDSGSGGMAQIVDRNTRTLLARRREQEKQRRLWDRLADRITDFAGSMSAEKN